MTFHTTVSLDNLHCVTPHDSGGEDPYLWAFYTRIDGTSVRQSASDPFRLSANVSITSGTGRPGNLNVEGIDSGSNIHIPANIGEFKTTLSPIELQFGVASGNIRVFVPGQVITYAVVIAEEGVPRHISSGIHDDVRLLVEQRVNDFLNGLDLLPLSITAITQGPGAMQTALNQQIQDFITDLKQEVRDYVKTYGELAVLSEWWNPFAQISSLLDPDAPIGNGVHFTFGEDKIITDNLAEHLHADVRESKSGLGGAWYIIDGHLDADLRFSPTDLLLVSVATTSNPAGQPQTVTFQKDHLCITAGTTVEITEINHAQTYGYAVQYPFANYRYTIDGQVLNGASGSVVLNKTVQVQQFDEDAAFVGGVPFIKNVEENRNVTIQFQKVRQRLDPQIEVLQLSNDPADGNYDCLLEVGAILNNGTFIPVDTPFLQFSGRTLEFPAWFVKGLHNCLDNFVGTRWAKSKIVSLAELWGPMQRQEEYERVAEQFRLLQEAGIFSAAGIEAALKVIAGKLRVPAE